MNICIFGDSITWGASDPTNGGWVTLLRNYFESETDRFGDISVYNLGINSATTTSTLSRIESESKARNADIIIFALGINDSATMTKGNIHQVDPIVFKANLIKITSIALQITPKIAFLGLTPIDDSKTNPYDSDGSYNQKDSDTYNDVIQTYCHNSHLPFIPLTNVLDMPDLSDGLHPNTKGHKKIFEITKNAIIKICS